MNRKRKIFLGLIVLMIAIVIGSQSWISMQFYALSLDPKVVQGIGKKHQELFKLGIFAPLGKERDAGVLLNKYIPLDMVGYEAPRKGLVGIPRGRACYFH